MKECKRCLEKKNLTEYHSKGREKLQSWCKKCIYDAQKKRWRERKRKVINLMGGKCQCCGYNKCIDVLEFHHLSPETKEYAWNKMRQLSWDKMIKEVKKCVLLCANCHREKHAHPDSFNFDEESEQQSFLDRELKPTGTCPVCERDVYGTTYCSTNCSKQKRRKVQNRPSKEQLQKDVDELGYCGTGRKYGVSDNAIRKWMK